MNKRLTWIGVSITALYLVAVFLLGRTKWDSLIGMGLNEVGDFLAGVAGPLALWWLILGYFQQGQELRMSSEALRNQAKELHRSAEEQSRLVAATQAQVAAHMRMYELQQAATENRFRPNLIVEPLPIDQGTQFVYGLAICNHGDIAQNVVVRLVSDELDFDHYLEMIPASGSVEITDDVISPRVAGEHSLLIDYTSRSGTMYRDTLGFVVLERGDGSWRAFTYAESLREKIEEDTYGG
ncbi:hypothetical protein ABFG95_06935 [Achromobacter sp. HNDS-1]|uniref:Uncharacterized protein n=1 Tax=Achromobacter sp. HNDS-1 TaxID=3151598 RepID=A0AAU7LE65_9BURK